MGIKISNDRIENFLVGKKFLLYQGIGDNSRYEFVFYEEENNDDVIKSIFEVSIKDGLGYVEHFDSSKEGFSNKIFEIQNTGGTKWKQLDLELDRDSYMVYKALDVVATLIEEQTTPNNLNI